ncbi:MAG: hypothetical protein EBY17_16600 [Acidobacteriia bacterium]|nr:hypothetical protein [Terriglobia bacterium]
MRLIFLFCLTALSSLAQTAALTGQVTDPSGAIVPGASVVVTRGEDMRKLSADANGQYSLAGLPPGEYQVSASAAQLLMPRPLNVTLRPGTAATLNLRLNVTGATQQVTVTSDAGPEVSTEASANASATVLKGDDLDALADDPEDLQADLEALAGPAAGPGGSAMFVDGFSGGLLPPKSSIREVRVNSNPFSPEYEQLGFGRIEIFTKPGTDKFHGNLGYNIARDKFNSRNPYSAQKAPLSLNEFENDISGRLSKRASFTLVVERHGVDNGTIINAVTLDPASLQPVSVQDFFVTPQRRLSIIPKVDIQLTPNNTIMLRWNYNKSEVKGAGIGGFDLTSRGRNAERRYQAVQATETWVHGTMVNEFRFQMTHHDQSFTANTVAPVLQVSGSFNGGGALAARSSDVFQAMEFHDYMSMVRGRHFWRMGGRLRRLGEDIDQAFNFNGTFTFAGGTGPQLDASNRPLLDPTGLPLPTRISSLEQYRRTLLFQRQGLPPAQVRALGGGASQYSVSGGQTAFDVNQFDLGIFIGDDWKLRPNLTLNLGLRFENQTNISDWSNFAPRLALAWAPGSTGKKAGKTVIRAGAGFFYERFSMSNTLAVRRFAGGAQQQVVVAQPDFYPSAPPISSLNGNALTRSIQVVDENLRTPRILQAALTLERQVARNTTLASTFSTTHVDHQYRSLAINTPLPGTGVLPFPGRGPIFLMASGGLFNQHQLRTNVNTKMSDAVSLFGNYTWSKAVGNSDGFGSYPANPWNYEGEYGPAGNDIRHRVQFGGTMTMRWNIRLSPLFTLQSGSPFNITTGQDAFNTTLFNSRPGLATSASKAGVVQTKYGLLDPNPVPGQALVGRNFGRGPEILMVNVRVARTWRFGRAAEGAPAATQSGSGPLGIFGGGAPAARPYSLMASLSARNLTNTNNPGGIIGNLSSPLFGRSNFLYGTTNGEGFSEGANNRRLELSLRFSW